MAETITQKTSELDIVQAKLDISETRRIELEAENAGLKTQIAEQTRLLGENQEAQKILSKAASELSNMIYEKELTIMETPDGLASNEVTILREARQAEIDTLKATQESYKQYIRGEL